MERSKPTQNHEQKQPTPEYDVVKNFPTDTTNLDSTRYPLTIIRSGQDGEDVKRDGGWYPSDMSAVVCDTGSKNGIGQIKLLMEVYKVVKAGIETELVPLEDIQGLGADKGYIEHLYGKTPEKMIEEAEQIWRQKHPDSRGIEPLAPGADSDSGAETPSNSLVEDNTSDHEKSLVDEVSPAMGRVAVETAGVEKPIYTNKVKTNEPVREPVKTDKTGVGSPALKIPEPTMELIRATEANGAVGLPAVESVKKPAVKATGIKKPVETGLDESDNSELDRFDERVRELMKPLEADVDGMPFEDESVRVNYDYLYDPNYVPSNNVEDAAVRNPKGVPVSENSFNAAKEAIYDLATNPSLMQIINPERALDPEAIINGIRSSHLTRCRLFEYLTSSLDRLAVVNPGALADRVLRDSYDNLKSPNYLGGNYYAGKMRSREYTVVLAIAMMDGSFDVDRQDKMVTHYRGGKERSGMHRDSARALLEYVRNNY